MASTPTTDRSADLAYLSCVQDTVLPSAQDFAERHELAVPYAAEDPLSFCTDWRAAGDLPGEVEALVLLHDRCPEPSFDCAVETQQLLELALQEMSTSVEVVEQWCQGEGDVLELPRLLGEAIGRMESYKSFLESTSAKLEECADEIAQ